MKKPKLYNNDLPKGIDFGDSVAIDSEMTGFRVNRDKLCLVQIADAKGNCYMVKFDGKNYNAPNLKALLKDKNIQKILQFARVDISFYKKFLGVTTNNIYCTKIASRLCRTYTDGHSLRNLTKELLDIDLEKETTHTDWSVDNLTDKQIEYAANDVIYLHKIRDILNEKLIRSSRDKIANECFKFLSTRAELDIEGFDDIDIFAHH